MVAWDSGLPLGPNICVAIRAFKRDVLSIRPSDFDEGSKQTSLGIKERSCASGVFVIIMRAELDLRTDLSRGRFS